MRNWMAFVGLFCLLAMNACTGKRAEVKLQRAEQTLFTSKSREQIQSFLNANREFARLYFNTSQFGNDTALVTALYTRINDPELNVLYRQVQDEFTDMKPLRNQLSEAFANIEKEFPTFRAPKIITTVTGFMGPDLVVTDSLVIIGLDYFAGPKAKYRPPRNEFPEYILRRYQKPYMAPAIVFAISDKYNATNRADQSLLADMVYYGKGYVFTKAMLPEVADGDSLVIGYTNRQLLDSYASQGDIWAHFIDNQLLYQTNPAVKQRYINERPFTAEISTQCPGAIGRWLGWRIVGRYHDTNASIKIADLMRNDNARNVFAESGYKGQKDEE
ncbi:MAG: gliding motility protein [Bacteroidetes bacterium]|nr:gliding motility protein [Fibrella sp.]